MEDNDDYITNYLDDQHDTFSCSSVWEAYVK